MKKLFAYLVLLCVVLGLFGCSTTCQHNWRPATCTAPETCSICGATEGNALGHRYSEGYCIRCDEKDPAYVAVGSVTGTVVCYKKSEYIDDVGTLVLLVSKEVTSLPEELGHLHEISVETITPSLPENVYLTRVDGHGAYSFDSIPTGEYYIVFYSFNGYNETYAYDIDRDLGPFYYLLSRAGQAAAEKSLRWYDATHGEVKVSAGQTSDFSCTLYYTTR